MSGLMERAVEALERIAAALEGGVAPAEKPTPETEKPKAEKPKAEKPKAEKPKVLPDGDSVSREDVRDALKAVQKAHGAEAARGILAGFDVAAISALDESQYPAVLEAAKAAL